MSCGSQLAEREREDAPKPFANRRVILQRKVPADKQPKASPRPLAIFSRAVRTALGDGRARRDAPCVEYDSASDDDERALGADMGARALVANLPHGMTDTRLKTLAGSDVQVTARLRRGWLGALTIPFFI